MTWEPWQAGVQGKDWKQKEPKLLKVEANSPVSSQTSINYVPSCLIKLKLKLETFIRKYLQHIDQFTKA